MDEQRPSQKFVILGCIAAAIGLGFSIYAAIHHLDVLASGVSDAYCNINDQFNCDDVARSKYSELFNIPLGVWGAGFFLAQIVLLLASFFKPKTALEHLWAYATLAAIGVVSSIALALISKFGVGVWCLNCMGVYGATFLGGIVAFTHRSELPSGITASKLFNGGISAALIVAVAIIGYNFGYTRKPTPKAPDMAELEEAIRNQQENAPKPLEIVIDRSPYSGLGEDFRKGSDNAKVVIVEFADFQCPACKRASELMGQVAKIYGDQIQIVYKNYPLDKSCNKALQGQIHPFACKAAKLARCAGSVGKFWQYHDLVYDRQSSMNDAKLVQWAGEIGLSKEKIDGCLASKDLDAKLAADMKQADQLNVSATPTLFMNGRKLSGGRDLESLQRQIEALLN